MLTVILKDRLGTITSESFVRSRSSTTKDWRFLLNSQRNYWTLIKNYKNSGHKMDPILRSYLLFLLPSFPSNRWTRMTYSYNIVARSRIILGHHQYWFNTWMTNRKEHMQLHWNFREVEGRANLSFFPFWSLISSEKMLNVATELWIFKFWL